MALIFWFFSDNFKNGISDAISEPQFPIPNMFSAMKPKQSCILNKSSCVFKFFFFLILESKLYVVKENSATAKLQDTSKKNNRRLLL